MARDILSQSANGRAIDCTDIIPGNNNYIQNGPNGMIVLIHKPAVVTTERVELWLSNPGKKRVTFNVDFNGQAMLVKLDRKSSQMVAFTVYGWNDNDPVISIRKDIGDELLVMGGIEF